MLFLNVLRHPNAFLYIKCLKSLLFLEQFFVEAHPKAAAYLARVRFPVFALVKICYLPSTVSVALISLGTLPLTINVEFVTRSKLMCLRIVNRLIVLGIRLIDKLRQKVDEEVTHQYLVEDERAIPITHPSDEHF